MSRRGLRRIGPMTMPAGLADAVFAESRIAMTVTRKSDATFIAANQAFCELAERSVDEVVGHSAFELNMWEDPARRDQMLAELGERGHVEDFVATFLSASGKRRTVRFSIQEMEHAGEACLVTTVRDVTLELAEGEILERRDAILEAVAFAAGRFLESADWTDGIEDVLVRLGRATGSSRVYVFSNGAASDGALTTTQLFEWCAEGVDPELQNPAMQNQRWIDSGLGRWIEVMRAGAILHGHVRDFPPQERPVLQPQNILSILVVPVFVGKEWWGHIGFDDCVRERAWSAAETDALRIAATTLGAAIQRRITERSRREAEELYRILVEQLPAVVYINAPTAEYRAVYTSPVIEELFGVTAQAYQEGFLWEQMIHPDDRDRVLVEDARTDDSLEPFRVEYRMVRPDGRIVWVRDEAEILRDEGGTPRFWSGVMFDITRLKLAEQELERALEIEREASSRLRALDEMKNTFLQAVSHDLRTPLAAVMGSALTLDNPEVALGEADEKDLVHVIAVNAKKLARLVTDLLDLDRLSSGLLEPNREPVDLADLVGRVVEESQALLGRPIEVIAQPISIELDAPKIERIVENLLMNAARHTPREAGIWVVVEPFEDGIQIRVDDEGPGIPEELRRSIFDAFERGPTPSAHAPGSGIGLTLVARFAELHGGRAWVEERPGGGSSFRVFLPRPRSAGA